MAQLNVKSIESMRADAVITYVPGCLTVVFRASLSLSARRAVLDTIGADSLLDAAPDVTLALTIPLGRAAHLVERGAPALLPLAARDLGRSRGTWQRSELRNSPTGSAHSKCVGAPPTASSAVNNSPELPTQRGSKPKLRRR